MHCCLLQVNYTHIHIQKKQLFTCAHFQMTIRMHCLVEAKCCFNNEENKNQCSVYFCSIFPITVGQVRLELRQNFKILVGTRSSPLAGLKREAEQLIMTVHLLFMWSHIVLCVKFGTSPFFSGFFSPQEFY